MTGVTEEVRDSWWENMNTCRAPVNFYFHWNWEFKNHAAINARCSNLIKPCVRSFVRYNREKAVECYFDRVFRSANTSKKRKLELESSFSDERAKLKFFRRGSNLSGIRFGKNEFAIGCSLPFPFLLHPLLRKKEKKKKKMFLSTLFFASSDRKRKFGNSCAKEGRTTVHWSISP